MAGLLYRNTSWPHYSCDEHVPHALAIDPLSELNPPMITDISANQSKESPVTLREMFLLNFRCPVPGLKRALCAPVGTAATSQHGTLKHRGDRALRSDRRAAANRELHDRSDYALPGCLLWDVPWNPVSGVRFVIRVMHHRQPLTLSLVGEMPVTHQLKTFRAGNLWVRTTRDRPVGIGLDDIPCGAV